MEMIEQTIAVRDKIEVLAYTLATSEWGVGNQVHHIECLPYK